MTPGLTLRPMQPDERAWAIDTMVRSWGATLPSHSLPPHAKRLVEDVISVGTVVVATVGDWPVGWISRSGPRMHYVYVRFSARGNGVARALLTRTGETIVAVTVLTPAGRKLCRRVLGRVPGEEPWAATQGKEI